MQNEKTERSRPLCYTSEGCEGFKRRNPTIKTISVILCVALSATPCLNLQGDLAPLEDAFLQAEADHGVDAAFLAAVAALESGWGESELAREKNNLFGWRGADGYMVFDSKEDCIDHVAAYLAKEYLDPDGIYYRGTAVEDVAKHYCGGNEAWIEAVKNIMLSVGS